MFRFKFMSFLIFLLLCSPCFAQNFSGKYSSLDEDVDLTLILQKNSNGDYTGSLSDEEDIFSVNGKLQNGILIGTVRDDLDVILFQAELEGSSIILTLAEVDEFNNPIPATAESFTLQKSRAIDTGNSPKNASRVVINGITLTEDQVIEFEERYGLKPIPGEYWYDKKSGLYGVVGYPAYGFMFAGHQYGKLLRNASNGNTGVLINGREIPQNEWLVWSYILGYWIQPGSYWLDDMGNAGYEGNPVPVVNLFLAGQQNAYSGGGGSGDNFWSSRFSAGNYDSGNQRGYVSVPGYGPVGYGF